MAFVLGFHCVRERLTKTTIKCCPLIIVSRIKLPISIKMLLTRSPLYLVAVVFYCLHTDSVYQVIYFIAYPCLVSHLHPPTPAASPVPLRFYVSPQSDKSLGISLGVCVCRYACRLLHPTWPANIDGRQFRPEKINIPLSLGSLLPCTR